MNAATKDNKPGSQDAVQPAVGADRLRRPLTFTLNVIMSHPLYQLLSQLEHGGIHFTLGRYRSDTVQVTLTLVGERVEIDVFDDGHMEVSRFKGSEDVLGGQELVQEILRQGAQ